VQISSPAFPNTGFLLHVSFPSPASIENKDNSVFFGLFLAIENKRVFVLNIADLLNSVSLVFPFVGSGNSSGMLTGAVFASLHQ
jgi:hypothetical protein